MPKFPIVYGVAGGILLAFLFVKFILPDSNLLLLLGCFMLAMGTLVALFEMKDMSTCPTGDKNEGVPSQPQQVGGRG
ncbi:MAG: hypothetical protein ACYCV0_08825 [Desulfitobacteriaceae bacterium]